MSLDLKMSLPYEMIEQAISIGPHNLRFKVIRDLDEAIDLLCHQLQKENTLDGNGLYARVFAEEMCPYFGRLWPSAIGLAKYLEAEDFKDQNILEIGCGLGLPSMLLALKGAHILATDFHPDVEGLFRYNCQQNAINCHYSRQHWLQPSSKKYPVIIGSDILYEGRHPEEIVKGLINLHLPGGKIIIADQGRGQLQRFVSLMQNHGFHSSISSQKMDQEHVALGIENKDIFIINFSSHK